MFVLRLSCEVIPVNQRELRPIVERLAGIMPQRRILMGDACLIKSCPYIEDNLLDGLWQRIEAAQYGHQQDDVTLFNARCCNIANLNL